MALSESSDLRGFLLGLLSRIVGARPRLFISMACGIVVGLVIPAEWGRNARLLIGWNAGALLYFILAGTMIATASHESTARRAETEDEGRFVILALTILAAAAAIGAIIAQLGAVKDVKGLLKGLHIALAATTIVSAWALIHLMFALHYAHEYFSKRATPDGQPAKPRGGLGFPGTETPDYLDFLYFSYIIGVACQTADVDIPSPTIRRMALLHGVLAFFFNSVILALMVNIAAGLI